MVEYKEFGEGENSEEIVKAPVKNMSEIDLTKVIEKSSSNEEEGIAKRIVEKSKEENGIKEEQVKMKMGPCCPVRKGGPFKEEMMKLAAWGLLLLALVLLIGGIYVLMDNGDSDKSGIEEDPENNKMNSVNLSIEEDQLEDPSEFIFRILSLQCSKTEVKVTAKLMKGNLEKVYFNVHHGKDIFETTDESAIFAGQTKEFKISLTDLEEDPWQIDISGIAGSKKYGVMDSKPC